MSSENELQAAERYGKYKAGDASSYDVPGEWPTTRFRMDLVALADAYLAALESQRREAEEGARPVDEAWLREIGFVPTIITGRFETRIRHGQWLVVDIRSQQPTKCSLSADHLTEILFDATRGDVLRLMAALKIEPKKGDDR